MDVFGRPKVQQIPFMHTGPDEHDIIAPHGILKVQVQASSAPLLKCACTQMLLQLVSAYKSGAFDLKLLGCRQGGQLCIGDQC